jgi:EAL domain-containing protein (putative c-di-GMP-specific phosphodiesterase class I)
VAAGVSGALASDAAELADALERAMERDELVALYHPVVALHNGRPVSFEALIRWNRPGVRMLAPGEFIGIAEQIGVIGALGRWMLRQAIADCALWQLDAPDVGVSINLSPRQFDDEALVENIEAALNAASIPPQLFEIEITEQVLTDDHAIHALARLRGYGVKVVLDDFGSGTSSLTVLDRAPIDALKIDMPVIAALEDPRDDARLINAITTVAHIYGLKVIAEGIDTTRKLQRLHALGCELGQGMLFGEPQPLGRVIQAYAHAPMTP